jgi:hypothetical protein
VFANDSMGCSFSAKCKGECKRVARIVGGFSIRDRRQRSNPGLVKSALSRFMDTRGPEEGAKVVIQLPTLPDDGPTGGFFDEKGPIPW